MLAASGPNAQPIVLYPPLTWATRQPSPHGPFYTQLTELVVDKVERSQPSKTELALRHLVIDIVTDVVAKALPEYAGQLKVLPFGSLVSGLGSHSSDIDLVVVGAMEPRSGAFYSKAERPHVAKLLDRIARGLRCEDTIGIEHMFTIRHARVPLCKPVVFLRQRGFGDGTYRRKLPPDLDRRDLDDMEAVQLDISVCNDAGPKAAQFMAKQCAKYPSLRPVFLVIKTYLKANNLNDVSNGGLSSYGLAYMVIASFMEQEKLGQRLDDLGWLLHQFFVTFGRTFRVAEHAVSIKAGGVVFRANVHDGHLNMDRLLCVDPLTDRHVTEGCSRWPEVHKAIQWGLRYLDRQARLWEHKDTDRDDTHLRHTTSLLSHLMDPGSDDDDTDSDSDDTDSDSSGDDAEGRDQTPAHQDKKIKVTHQPPAAIGFTYPSQEEQAAQAIPLFMDSLPDTAARKEESKKKPDEAQAPVKKVPNPKTVAKRAQRQRAAARKREAAAAAAAAASGAKQEEVREAAGTRQGAAGSTESVVTTWQQTVDQFRSLTSDTTGRKRKWDDTPAALPAQPTHRHQPQQPQPQQPVAWYEPVNMQHHAQPQPAYQARHQYTQHPPQQYSQPTTGANMPFVMSSLRTVPTQTQF